MSSQLTFKPLNGRILVKPDASELQKQAANAGIVLDSSLDKEKPITGTVVVGGASTNLNDRVLFSKYAFDELTIDKELYYVIYETSVLGIF